MISISDSNGSSISQKASNLQKTETLSKNSESPQNGDNGDQICQNGKRIKNSLSSQSFQEQGSSSNLDNNAQYEITIGSSPSTEKQNTRKSYTSGMETVDSNGKDLNLLSNIQYSVCGVNSENSSQISSVKNQSVSHSSNNGSISKKEKFILHLEFQLQNECITNPTNGKQSTGKICDLILKYPDYFEDFFNLSLYPIEDVYPYDKNKHIAFMVSECFRIGLNKNVIKLFFKSKKRLFFTLLNFLKDPELIHPAGSVYFTNILLNIQKSRDKDFWEFIDKNYEYFVQLLIKHVSNVGIADYIGYLLTFTENNNLGKSKTDKIKYELAKQLINMVIEENYEDDEDSLQLQNILNIIVNFLCNNIISKRSVYAEISEQYLFNPEILQKICKKLESSHLDQHNISYLVGIINYIYVFFYFKMGDSLKPQIPLILDLLKTEQESVKKENYIKTQYLEYVMPFGLGRMQTLELFENFFRGGNKSIIKAVCDSDFFSIIIKLYQNFESNSILHNQLERIIQLSITSLNSSQLEDLLIGRGKLVDFIIRSFSKQNIQAVIKGQHMNFHKSYIGSLTLIGFSLQDSCSQTIQKILNNHQYWNSFVTKKLSQRRKLFKFYNLGGGSDKVNTSLEQSDGENKLPYEMQMSLNSEKTILSPRYRLSSNSAKEEEKEDDNSYLEFVFVVDEESENNKRDLLQKMSTQGCGRQGKCINKYCLDNPKKTQITEKEIEYIVSNEKIISCEQLEKAIKKARQEEEEKGIISIEEDLYMEEVEFTNSYKQKIIKQQKIETQLINAVENPPLNSFKNSPHFSPDANHPIYFNQIQQECPQNIQQNTVNNNCSNNIKLNKQVQQECEQNINSNSNSFESPVRITQQKEINQTQSEPTKQQQQKLNKKNKYNSIQSAGLEDISMLQKCNSQNDDLFMKSSSSSLSVNDVEYIQDDFSDDFTFLN